MALWLAYSVLLGVTTVLALMVAAMNRKGGSGFVMLSPPDGTPLWVLVAAASVFPSIVWGAALIPIFF